MELMKENQPVQVDATWNNTNVDGLDLLLKAAHKTNQPKPAQKKSKLPSMVLSGSYNIPVIVGRGSQATLNLGRINKQVSRRHAIVEWCQESITFQITVLGQNGVRINGIGYPSGQQATLREGDIVDLVGVKMLFRGPPGASPAQEYEGSELFEDDLDQADELDPISMPLGLVTPKRVQKANPAHQLATPTHSSPIRESPQLTPTARMRHKTLKYDLSSTNRTLFNSPPPSSDAATEFGSSPVRSRPVFTLAMDTSPVRRPTGLESPRSEPNIFMDDSPPKSPSKFSNQRLPLAPLSLMENGQSNPPRAPTTTNRVPSGISSQTASSPAKTKSSNTLKPSALSKLTTADSNANLISSQPVKQQKSSAGVKDAENKAPAAPKQEKSKAFKNLHKPSVETSKIKESHKSPVEVKAMVEKVHRVERSDKAEKAGTAESKPTSNKNLKEHVRPAKSGEESANKIHPSPIPVKEQTPKSSSVKSSAKESTKMKEEALAPVRSNDLEKDGIFPSSLELTEAPAKKAPVDYTEMIIDTLVFARKKKSMTLSELFEEMIASQPSLMATQNSDEIKEQMLQCLSAARCVGKITRKGKDAYNKPLENQWYYIPESDHNVMRKLTRQEVMPSARKCTLKDKQYFFKMPPKLPYHRKSTSPYAVKPSARRTKESSKLSAGADDLEAGEPSSSDPDEADEPVLATRKRKSANAGHVDKKRKGIASGSVPKDAEDEDEDDDVQNDSLDDLSELSGLSD